MSAQTSIELGDAVLAPVRTHHVFEGCVEQLATAIRLGALPRGASLPNERDLAQKLGVSRATLREAIAALREARLVTTTRGHGGGTVVSYKPAKPSSRRVRALASRGETLRDTLVFRRLVEPGACFVAAGRELSSSERDALTAAHSAVATATDPATHRQADSRFHLAIAAAAGSPSILRAVVSVQADVHDMLISIPMLEVNIDHSDRQHRSILRAILGGRETQARRAMELHCDDTAALLRGLLG